MGHHDNNAAQVIGRPFKPGQSGNPAGRPRGSRHRLSEAALAALCADFEAGGAAAIEKARTEDPVGYLRVVASLLPKQIEKVPNPLEDLTDAELEALDAWIAAFREGEADHRADPRIDALTEGLGQVREAVVQIADAVSADAEDRALAALPVAVTTAQ